MTHFMFYAGKAYNYRLQKESAQKLLKENSAYLGESYLYVYRQANIDPVEETIKDGYHQESSDRIAAKHSAYSYEDLPTDKFGAILGAKYFNPNSKLSFGEQLKNYLETLGVTPPDKAPNYNQLPSKEVETPTRENHSTKPVYTSDNP